jgi:hypothetical protein
MKLRLDQDSTALKQRHDIGHGSFAAMQAWPSRKTIL